MEKTKWRENQMESTEREKQMERKKGGREEEKKFELSLRKVFIAALQLLIIP